MTKEFTKYELPELGYDFNALEPVISSEIMYLHYDKHHRAYVNNLNHALEKYLEHVDRMELDRAIAFQQAITFNGGGHLNHSLFWTSLAPQHRGGGTQVEGKLKKALIEQFGSFETFRDQMSRATVSIAGSGWGWLGYCQETKKLTITTCPNQDPLVSKGLIPILGIDVWEHAYYLQYKNVRAEYVKNIWNIIDWAHLEERYQRAAAEKSSK